jgi:hypothetical protein
MLNPFQVPAFITGKLPQIKKDLSGESGQPSAYQSIQVLTDYTKRMALKHDFSMVKKCMLVVEKVYEQGNNQVKNAVENIFIFSLSSMMTLCNIVEWRIVLSYMPAGLYSLYVQQVLKSNC